MTMPPPLTAFVRLAVAGLLTLGLAACGGSDSDPLAGPDESAGEGAGSPLVVGSANFPESEILAEIYAGALNGADVPATTRVAIGSREVYFAALQDGSIDLVPEYSGNLLRHVDPESTEAGAEEVMSALRTALPADMAVLEPAEAENKNTIVVTRPTAEEYGLASLVDLAEVCDQFVFGAPPEARTRPQGLPGLESTYGCVFKEFVPVSDAGGPLTVQSLVAGELQAANVFSTSPLIAQNDLVTLDDPRELFAAQQVVPLVRSDRVEEEAAAALDRVSAELTTEDLMELNSKVSGDTKQSPQAAAADWLAEKGLAD